MIVPAGIHSGEGNLDGAHSYDQRQGQRIHFIWTADSANVDSATAILSHELVEAVTDPEGTGFLGVAGTCHQHGWCEIADICGSTGLINGVTVQSYWSNRTRNCIIPSRSNVRPISSEMPVNLT